MLFQRIHDIRLVRQPQAQGNAFTALGYAYIGPIDGHNIRSIERALKRAKNTKKSVVIQAVTIKGKG